MDYTKVIEKLNEALRHEWTGVAQYAQAGFVVSGLWREVYADFFHDNAKESFGHAKLVGEKLVALGAIPTVERNPIKQSDNLEEILQYSLEFEQKAVAVYTEAIALAEAESKPDRALVIFLEDLVKVEQEGVDEIVRILRGHGKASATGGTSASKVG